MSTTKTAHILVFPYPAQGHMSPLLDLAHQLALRSLTITIVVTPKNLPLLTPLLALHPEFIRPLLLPFPTHPSIPAGVENVKGLPAGYFRPMMLVMAQLHQPLLNWFHFQPSPPIAILSDFFLGWTHNLAVQLGIPRIVFSPSGAMAYQVLHALFHDMPKPQPNPQNAIVSFPTIPTSPKFSWWQLFLLYRSFKEGEPESEFTRDNFLANSASWGVVVNSFDELESVYLHHLKTSSADQQRVWAVGPLLPVPTHDSSSAQGGSTSILSWLHTCPDMSVVYVCFGSQTVLNNKQMEGVAVGLERSQTRFIWCVKEPTVAHASGEYGKVPDGFEDRMAGRGIVIKGWAPQVSILRHKAVAAFMTHCGWNSIMEAILAGVPMLAWAMIADQFINATLLVDQLGVAVRVCEGIGTIPNSSELAKALDGSVSLESRERARVMDLCEAALGGVKGGGKSFKELDDLVEAFCELKPSK